MQERAGSEQDSPHICIYRYKSCGRFLDTFARITRPDGKRWAVYLDIADHHLNKVADETGRVNDNSSGSEEPQAVAFQLAAQQLAPQQVLEGCSRSH